VRTCLHGTNAAAASPFAYGKRFCREAFRSRSLKGQRRPGTVNSQKGSHSSVHDKKITSLHIIRGHPPGIPLKPAQTASNPIALRIASRVNRSYSPVVLRSEPFKPDCEGSSDFCRVPRSHSQKGSPPEIAYEAVTVHSDGDKEPLRVSRVQRLAESPVPGSSGPSGSSMLYPPSFSRKAACRS
jgi:hypothetical protein